MNLVGTWQVWGAVVAVHPHLATLHELCVESQVAGAGRDPMNRPTSLLERLVGDTVNDEDMVGVAGTGDQRNSAGGDGDGESDDLSHRSPPPLVTLAPGTLSSTRIVPVPPHSGSL